MTQLFPKLNGLRGLVVDDNVDSLMMLKMWLELCGVQVMPAVSVQDALSCIAQSPIDFLITDLAMPNENGYDLLRQVRSLRPEQKGYVPAIALTAWTGEGVQQQAMQAGFQSYIPKPFEPDQLMATLSRLAKPNECH